MKRTLELLAPAADKQIARQAILHGADAVYMGGPSHGARKKAANSIEDILDTVDLAHQYRAKVYVTVNTLVYEHEFKDVELLCYELYRAGVDALIVQDMSLLRLDIPPIALHASTQCDTRTAAKAKFLEKCGFSQIVLARELSLSEIREISSEVNVPVECFVHGALCVSYSGRCSISQISTGRSANRGECAQFCRLPYTLRNGNGEIIERDKYLLSLSDFNTIHKLQNLVEAGVSSFKIEGRLKDDAYVRNVTAAYRIALDNIIAQNPDKYRRSSFGESEISFTPDLNKSFNRGFTNYFLDGRNHQKMASLRTPKSMGEKITDIRSLNNGDGISYFDEYGQYQGVGVNGVKSGRIIGSRPFKLPPGTDIYRTFDIRWQSQFKGESARRLIKVDISIDESGVSASDEMGNFVRLPLDVPKSVAHKPMNPESIFAKLGGTHYRLDKFENNLDPKTFIQASRLTEIRRQLMQLLSEANVINFPFDYRRKEEATVPYPFKHLDSRDNVANSKAAEFYREHGVESMQRAVEVTLQKGEQEVMTTRYCLRREMGCCLLDKGVNAHKRNKFRGPLTISTGNHTFRLDFDCSRCEMKVIAKN